MKKGISLLLVFLLAALLPCAAFAETLTREEFAAMQSLPELYQQYGSVLRTYSFQKPGDDAKALEWVWYSETEEGTPVFGFFDGMPSLACDGFTFGYSEDGTLTAWLWLSGWEEAAESWSAPMLELPQEELELIAEEDGSYSLIYEPEEGWALYGSLDSGKQLSSVISLYDDSEIVLEELLTFCPMEQPLVGLDLEALSQDGTRLITCVCQDGTELTFQVPQSIQLGFASAEGTCGVFLDAEGKEAVTYLPAGSDPVTIYEAVS